MVVSGARAAARTSMQYVAIVYGAPMKPSTVASLPTSFRRSPSVCCTNGHASTGSMRWTASISAAERSARIFGPAFSRMSNSIPMPGSGVRMSEKRMTPSVLYASHG